MRLATIYFWVGVLLTPLTYAPDSAAQGNVELVFEGNWSIELHGHPRLGTARTWLSKGLHRSTECSTTGAYANCRAPEAAWAIHSTRPGNSVVDGETGPVEYQISIANISGNQMQVTHAYGTRSTLVVSDVSNDVLVGRWVNDDGESGEEIWRRDSPPTINRVECRVGSEPLPVNANGLCVFKLEGQPARGAMRGNLPTVTFDIFGPGFRGFGLMPILDSPETQNIEVESTCYYYEKPFTDDGGHGCASWGVPHVHYGEIVGIRANVNVFNGARPGVKTITFGGQRLAFYLDIPPIAGDEAVAETDEITVERIDFVEADKPYANIESLFFMDRFRVQVTFDRAPESASATVNLVDPAVGSPIDVTVYATQDPAVMRSGEVLLEPVAGGEVLP